MTEQPTVFILTGLPAAGKSTFAHAWRQADPNHRDIVNRDQLRNTLFGQYNGLTQQQEDIVTEHEINLAEQALRAAKSVMVDDTNRQPQHLAIWTALANRHHVTHQIITIDTPLAECLERNRRRAANGGRFVPEHVIHEMHAIAQAADAPNLSAL